MNVRSMGKRSYSLWMGRDRNQLFAGITGPNNKEGEKVLGDKIKKSSFSGKKLGGRFGTEENYPCGNVPYHTKARESGLGVEHNNREKETG